MLAHPHDALKTAYALILSGGPALYLLGSAVYKKVVYGVMPASHIVGVAVLLVLIPVAPFVDLLTMGWLTTIVMLAVGFWEGRRVRQRREVGKPAAMTH